MRASELRRIGHSFDRILYNAGHRMCKFLIEHRILISVLLVGFIVWALVFNAAVIDYTQAGGWTSRSSWLGPFPDPDTVFVFGYAVDYQIEGYSDYSFYYVHWGYNFLHGTMPYSPEFGYLDMNGITNENGSHLFPPFTSYLYAFGIWLGNQFGWANWGIGFLLAGFGFLTALPIYGIASELSSNRRVGEVAALTYLLNPLVLYHTDFLWFNPAPFVFFFFSGFYMLIKGRRLTGTLLIVTAALFKQSAWFFGIPLIVYLLVKRREKPPEDEEVILNDQTEEKNEEKPKPKPILQTLTDYFDLRAFAVSVIIVLAFVGAVMFPYLIAQPDFLNYWRLALGSFSFEGNFVDAPPYNVPMRVQALLIMAGLPGAAEILDFIIISGGPMIFAVIVFLGVMMMKDRYLGEEKLYLRRILFMTFMMMLLINIVGARGVFKYYFVATVPFISIFSSARMIRGTGEHVPFSISMALLPLSLTLMILIPDRNFYLAYVILIFILYLLTPLIDRFYGNVKRPISTLRNRLPLSFEALTLKTSPIESRKSLLVNWVTRFTSMIIGLSLLAYGFWIGTYAVGANLIVVLTVLLIVGIALTLGPQMVSIALSFNNADDQNETLQNYSYVTTAAMLIYGIGTYIQAWEVLLTNERQLLILSGIFVTIWASSLVIKLGVFERLIADMFLLGGIAFGLNIWFILGNLTLQMIGVLCLSALVIHIIAVLSGIVHSRQQDTIATTGRTNETQTELANQVH